MHPTTLLFLGFLPHLVSAAALKARQTVACEISIPASAGDTCDLFAASWGLTVAGFQALNPGVSCPALVTGHVYCVYGSVSTPSTTSTSTSTTSTSTMSTSSSTTPVTSSSSSSTLTTTTTKTSATVTSTTLTTPTTAQSTTTTTQSATTAVPHTTTPTTSATTTATTAATTTTPGNGVSTPVPTQTGMVGSCNKFHFVNVDQTCATIAALYSISVAQFIQWNPAAKSDCTGLWASTYACVGVIGGTPPPTTTRTGNGVTTPTPAHPGMLSNCNKFAYVNPGDTCDGIAFWNGIGGQWVKLWNGIEEECRSIQANTYVCVGLISGNGIATPTPAHPGMVNNCKKFAYVNPGDTCDGIGFWNGIGGQLVKLWNGIEEACLSIQAKTYVCVGVM